jgi:hypothetical protein
LPFGTTPRAAAAATPGSGSCFGGFTCGTGSYRGEAAFVLLFFYTLEAAAARYGV